jgi:hypothetical protein
MIEQKKKKENNIKEVEDFYKENSEININNINNISVSSSKTEEIQYLNKKRKRKNHRNIPPKELSYNNENNSLNISEEKYNDSYTIELLDKEEFDKQKKGAKEETISEKEILSQINEIFNGNDSLKENESKNNNRIKT